MALKTKSSAKKAVKKTVSTRKPTRPIKAKSVEKRAVARPAPKSNKPEPPALDHGQKIGPLFLGAGHGHLSRAVDKQWLDAIERYRTALSDATQYEGKRSPQARAALVLMYGKQLMTMMQNLTLRVQALAHESATLDASLRAPLTTAARTLVGKIGDLNGVLGEMVGVEGIAPLGDLSIPSGSLQAMEQMQRTHVNNVARIADLERSVS